MLLWNRFTTAKLNHFKCSRLTAIAPLNITNPLDLLKVDANRLESKNVVL